MAINLLDRLIGIVAPDSGLRRLRSRALLERAYEGASQRDGWRPRRPGASANTDHRADAGTLRVRARALVQNSPYISRGLESLVSNIIGTGITPRSLAANAVDVDKLWAEWCRVADADGRLDLYGLEAAAYRAMEQDGEVLIRLRNRRAEDGLPVPLQLQLLEIDWLDSSKVGTNKGNNIVNGIEYEPIGRVAAYWLWDQHPGEVNNFNMRRATSYPVPAASVIHLYNPQRPGQGRGFTRLAPVVARVRDLQLYEDAELQRKNLETRLSVLASGDITSMSMTESASQDEVRKTGELGMLASGGITQVPAGVNLTVVEPKAAGGYVEYVKYQLHLIAAGMGVTYEMLTGDVGEVNFSSARVALLEFRRGAEQTQWLTLIPKMLDPIWRAFIDAAVLAGKLRRADYGCDWSTPKWDYVNPEQDVKADLAEISGGLSTISEKLRRRGYKPELVFAEIKSDFERLRKDGTLDILLQLQAGQAPQPVPVKAPAAVREPEEPLFSRAEQRQHANERRALDNSLLAAQAKAAVHTRAQTPEPPGPVVNIHQAPVTVHPAEVRVLVPETTVTVEAIMPAQAIQVRADAPAVTIVNEITALAAPAQVTVAHPSETVAEHQRDPKTQEILRTVTTFKD
jgi:lambda family phage portal protein